MDKVSIKTSFIRYGNANHIAFLFLNTTTSGSLAAEVFTKTAPSNSLHSKTGNPARLEKKNVIENLSPLIGPF